ncbi:ashwin [Nilaparvata lugens]|uniref:ashwin n=1 Tax=Nilaparvata lugens TaxID=108931 RepID=UPI00193D653D|nr:ashwin [Nilaparvata lugens]XP_039288064.1 ashwin [Nilaparvata lugens]
MDDSKNDNVSLSMQLLQPELLLKSTLIEILKSRCVSGDLTSWDNEKLVDLYRRVVLPLPQRIITSGCRKNTLKSSTKCKITGPDSREEKRSYKIGFNGLTSPKPSIGSSATKDRLKPPPDCSNKKLKVSSGNETKQSDETTDSSKSETKKTPPAKVALKRPSSQAKECQSTPSKVVCTTNSSSPEDKKARSKITWP